MTTLRTDLERSLRAYTVAELDLMRWAIIRRGERPLPNNGGMPQDMQNERLTWERAIEERLRSYMIVGIDPLDLVSAPIIDACRPDGKSYASLDSTSSYVPSEQYKRDRLQDDWHGKLP